jgi:hypothetical protein
MVSFFMSSLNFFYMISVIVVKSNVLIGAHSNTRSNAHEPIGVFLSDALDYM